MEIESASDCSPEVLARMEITHPGGGPSGPYVGRLAKPTRRGCITETGQVIPTMLQPKDAI